MKKIIYLITIAVVAFSCKEEVPRTINYTIIAGQIKNKTNDKISIRSFDGIYEVALKIENNGSFMDTLKMDTGHYMLKSGRNRATIYLVKGHDITIEYDAESFENTLRFSGKESKINTYLLEKQKAEKQIIKQSEAFFKLPEAEYKHKLDTIKLTLTNLLSITKGLPEDYKIKEKRNIQYSYLVNLKEYEFAHRYFTKNDTFKVSNHFLKELEGLPYTSEEDFLFSKDYKSLVLFHFSEKIIALAEKDTIPIYQAIVKTANTIKNDTIKNAVLYVNTNRYLSKTEHLEKLYTAFISASTNTRYKQKITKLYNQLLPLAKGQPSPVFTNYKNHAGGTTSLTDLKGKYVYIDVWATWCAPCKEEIPFLQRIEKEYHDRKIEFVSISVDQQKDKDKWRNMVKEKELSGIQLFADNNFKSKFVKDYKIQGIPRFILLDSQGNIVSADAPRPSEEELIKLFDELGI
ncbi:TlpA disulfide reductase family protein [uncultured Polaribacter sp.]|uniref:TlpA family protein disulfide reductase n=1 Tax=uncultured Polaribacter sp. TaxID=174711 RepID=UPI0026186AA6|nr:TlpA disulfide reductase family protein [uncultured Polaribacter sp.]